MGIFRYLYNKEFILIYKKFEIFKLKIKRIIFSIEIINMYLTIHALLPTVEYRGKQIINDYINYLPTVESRRKQIINDYIYKCT